MSKRSFSIRLSEAHIKALQSKGPTGLGMSRVLAKYDTKEKIADAVKRHVLDPHKDDTPIKQTSIYVEVDELQALRRWVTTTHLPFESLIRILIDDNLKKQD
jgi:hypothetical protein